MEHTEILPDITNSCRLCLKSNSNIRNIFTDNHKKWASINIAEQILRATTIEVTIGDGAIGICKPCLQNIVTINNFQRKCIKVNEYLKTKYQGIYFSGIDRKPAHVPDDLAQFVDIGEELVDTKTFLFDDVNPVSTEPFLNDFNESNETLKTDFALNLKNLANEIIGNNEINNDTSNDIPTTKSKYKQNSKQKSKSKKEVWPKILKRDLNPSNPNVGLCHICGKNFNRLWIHLQSHNVIPMFTCDICGKGFQLKATLTIHILLHKDAEIKCEICDKRYRTKMRLKRHLRVHTGDRPFSCHICQKKFYTKYNVGVHMRIHTGEKPYNCDYCSERFTHSYGLKHHLKKFHGYPES